MQVVLHPTTICFNNIIRFGDVAKLSGNDPKLKELEQTPLSPSPTIGSRQAWKRDDIEKILRLRGIDVSRFQWTGSSQCFVERSSSPSENKEALSKLRISIAPPANEVNPTGGFMASHLKPSTEHLPSTDQLDTDSPQSSDREIVAPASFSNRLQSTSDATPQKSSGTVNTTNSFHPAFVSPAAVAQAEHVVASLIETHIQSQNDTDAIYYVTPNVAPEHAKGLLQRRNILGISGGVPPYDGEQQFEVLVKHGEQELKIPINANVQLPDLFLAAKTQLPKGHILRSEDLTYTILPRGSKQRDDEFFLRMDELIGKELKRSMSTRQLIKRAEVGIPKLIHAGDLVKIEVVVGGVVIETSGKALEGGGLDELVQVETIDYRKRLIARVKSERVVEVYSHGNATTYKPSTKHSNTKPRYR